jgi:antitoxin VapB
MSVAKLFKVGGSQAVRLPKEFRFSGDTVRIHREGDRVILEPNDMPGGRSVEDIRAWLSEIQTLAGGGFERPEQPPLQERDWAAFD